jgi:fructokinase
MMDTPNPQVRTLLADPPSVVSLGEVLWDVFDDEARFGGAPANLACHAAAFGARVTMVSGVGDDLPGTQAMAVLRDHGVNVDAVACIPDAPTGSVRVSLDAKGLAHYTVQPDVAWDRIPWTPALERLASRADAACFGTIAQRGQTSRQTIRRFLDATGPHCLRVFDANLRQDYYDRTLIEQSLQRSTVLRLNDAELSVFAAMFGLDGAADAEIRQLLERFGLQLVILTLGDRGAILCDRAQTVVVAAEPVQVVDTVGAGDAFGATITMGLLAGCDLRAMAEHASRVAGYVCAHRGAVPELPPALRQLPGAPQQARGR